MKSTGLLLPTTRAVLGITIVLLALSLLMAAWSIPFTFESFSILYKFGTEKTYLRSGKVVGITIVILVFYQVILASKFKLLEQVFSAKNILTLHRINGMAIACLVIVHPLLIKASENFTPYTFEKKYFPEFLGIGLFCIILLLSFTAMFRKFFKVTYSNWQFMHRLFATLALLLMPGHLLFVSETFKSGLPRHGALGIIGLNLLLIIRIWLSRLLQKGR